jgi:Bifunctional DNA primase/polymerase, N-terminal
MHGPLGASSHPPHHGARRELWALYYASRGWRVLPLHTVDGGRCSCGDPKCPSPGAHPRTQNGVKDASENPEQIRAWWEECPDAGVGIATGADSGLVILEIDHHKGGDESYIQLQQELSTAFAHLLKVRTGSGGTHLYFEHPGGDLPSRANVRPGIDVQADGGYVIAPPSLDVNGARSRFTSNGPLLRPRFLELSGI